MTMMALLLLEAGATAKKPHWKNSCNGNKCLSYYVTFVQLFSCSRFRPRYSAIARPALAILVVPA